MQAAGVGEDVDCTPRLGAGLNEFVYPLLFIQCPSKFTPPTFIGTLITEDETFWGGLSAIGFLASLPILFLVGFV